MAIGKTHTLKIKHYYLADILHGNKNFEVRLNDRDYKVNDRIVFLPIAESGELLHCMEAYLFIITYVHSEYGMADNFVVLGIEEIKQ